MSELKLNVMVENLGEDAHETTLTLNLPQEVSYIGVQTKKGQVCCFLYLMSFTRN